MTLFELESLLLSYPERFFRIQLPEASAVPISFHITEVGYVHKRFFDCGGKLRESHTCQLQIWVGQDYEHRIETKKMAGILEKGKVLLPDNSLPVEIEYEDSVISQYTISGHLLSEEAVILQLAHKHTECLAPELCGLPSINRLTLLGGKASCSVPSCC